MPHSFTSMSVSSQIYKRILLFHAFAGVFDGFCGLQLKFEDLKTVWFILRHSVSSTMLPARLRARPGSMATPRSWSCQGTGSKAEVFCPSSPQHPGDLKTFEPNAKLWAPAAGDQRWFRSKNMLACNKAVKSSLHHDSPWFTMIQLAIVFTLIH